MNILDLDIETYCDLELKKVGAYKYIAHESFQVLLLAYVFNGSRKGVIDLYQDPVIPKPLLDLILSPNVIIRAHNWTFERLGLSKHIGVDIPAWRGQCSMVKAGMSGLPLGLKEVGKVLNIKTQKDARGDSLIRYFTKPCKPTKANGGRTRNLPEHAPEAWHAFKQYNLTDVYAEIGVEDKLSIFKMPTIEKELYILDQKINDRGILVDRQLIKNALLLDTEHQKEQLVLFKELTGLNNPKSLPAVKNWMRQETDIIFESLNKDNMDEVQAKLTKYPHVLKMLDIRSAFFKTSIKKYNAMHNMMGADGRIRGLHQMYGAGRTGRFAGRGLQPHNLARNKYKELAGLRNLLHKGDFDLISSFYDVPDVLSQLIRPAIRAPKDHILGITDFTSIEAVIISWLAGEKWRLEAFKNNVDIYKASASQMFDIPLEAINDEYRQRGKVSELALGFQGSVGALIRMGALKMGIPEKELLGLVMRWRTSNPAIVRMWGLLEDMAYKTVKTGVRTNYRGLISMFMYQGRFIIELPSKRWLVYHNAKIIGGKITYEGMNDKNKWVAEETYGGKITENIVQAIARDLLAIAMLRLDRAGFDIVMHVHDEIVMELPNPQSDRQVIDVLDRINEIMAKPVIWAKDAPIKAKTFLSPFYKKD